MSLFRFKALTAEDPAVPLGSWSVLLDMMGASQSDAGMVVNERHSLHLSAVQACVRVIAETLGTLPLNVYQRVGKGKVKAETHRMWPLLHDTPNPQMTAVVFREAMTAQTLLWGNGYAEIQRDRAGRVVALWPLPSDRTRPVRKDNQLKYETEVQSNLDPYVFQVGFEAPNQDKIRYLNPSDVLHIPGLSFNGLLGMSPIQLARQTVGLSMAAERFGALFFGNGSRPSGILTHPGRLRPEARKNIEESFREANSRENAQRAIVLEEGITWNPMSVPPEDSQFIQTRQFQIAEIARIFRVPLHLIQDLSRSTNNNIEQQSIEFVMHTVRPWAVRWEQELCRKLLGAPFFAEHDISGLLRGDWQSRMLGYQALRNLGAISANDIREAEGWNPVSPEEGGDVLIAPLNMTPLAALAKQEESAEGEPGDDDVSEDDGSGTGVPDDPAEDAMKRRMIGAFIHLFTDAVGRTVKRENRTSKATHAIFAPAITALAESMVALEFPHPRRLTAAAHVLIFRHACGVSERAASWNANERDQIAASEASRAYDVLANELPALSEDL